LKLIAAQTTWGYFYIVLYASRRWTRAAIVKRRQPRQICNAMDGEQAERGREAERPPPTATI